MEKRFLDITKELTAWLRMNMERRNFGVSETASAAGISHPLISDSFKGKKPSMETCTVLAKLFKTTPEQVLRMAGLLPPIAQKEVIRSTPITCGATFP